MGVMVTANAEEYEIQATLSVLMHQVMVMFEWHIQIFYGIVQQS
jgi:hypothetical protein